MNNSMKKILTLAVALFFAASPVFTKTVSGEWHNDLRSLFIKNNAIIYTINIRTFNAKDKNRNDIIDGKEESGNFLNAIDELDGLKKSGINTLHILPVTPVGKTKALGTAGSLYALAGFDEINPQLASNKTSMTPINQAKMFIKECHRRNIRVIIDLPSCGSYDLFETHPEYFLKDEDGNPVVPLDWSDVLLFDTGDKYENNHELIKLHKSFIDMVISIGADGIRADVAGLKTPKFWSEIIDYAREKDDEFLFLAESSKSWTEPVSADAICTPSEELLKAGFDGYLGSYFNLKNMKEGSELISLVQSDQKMFKKFKYKKSVIGSFSTHDEESPNLLKGGVFSKMIIWLNSTLPLNSYYIDGFPTGDTYTYLWSNKPAKKTETDCNKYFVHNGKIDIFNFSRKPGGDDYTINEEFILANKFKEYYAQDLSNSKFVPLKSGNIRLFAYARVLSSSTIIVIGNLDFSNPQSGTIKVPKLKPDSKIMNMRVQRNIQNEYSKGKIDALLQPGDIQVLMVKNLVF